MKPTCKRCGREHESIAASGRIVLVDPATGRCGGCTCQHGNDPVGCPLCARSRMWRDYGMLGPEEEDP